MKRSDSYHVYPSNGAWSVLRRGARRAYRAGLSRRDAMWLAVKMAHKLRSYVYLHDETGRIVKRQIV